MGVLDDAIRQHLELKRAHGASEEEIRRQEVEALGPARREVAGADAPAAADPQEADAAGEVGGRSDAGEAPPAEADLFAAGRESAADAEPYADDPEVAIADERLASSVGGLAPDEPAFVEEDDLEEGYDAPEPPGRTALGEPLEREGMADDEATPEAERSAPALESPGEDDVLEETPDFLQETPEHDRLWFEQKPPRDFDFE